MISSRIASYGFLSLLAAAHWTTARADESPAQNKVIVNDPDDRLSTVPTNWWTYSHQSVQDVTNTASTQNARIVDISVEQVAPSLTFTVTYVENAGPYYKGWLWYPATDAATIANAISANNARLISLKAFDAGGGQIRFAAVMIGNAGKDTKPSWYYTDLSADQITSNLAANNARLTQISSYLSGGTTHYAVVMVAAAASDPQSWWYADQTPAQITSLLAANNARLIDLDHVASDGNYNAIMVGCGASCPAWWWNTGQTQSQMQALAVQNAGRIIHSSAYAGCDGVCLSYILVDNTLPALDGSNAVTSRVGQLLRAGGINGVQGLYLKQVGGPVLANLEESFVYEPASSIKVLAHLYAMTQVQNGAATLADSVQRYTNGPTSCPDPAQQGGTEPLSMALQEMMWHSDNARTREITDTFGDSAINAFGASIGMQSTQINHIIGCAGPIPDRLTLVDAAALYEGIANGTLLTPDNQTKFTSLMAGKGEFLGEGFDFTHLWDTDIPAMIAQAAPGATTAQKRDYLNQMNLAYKAGSYEICSDSCSHIAEYYSITGWVEIPFCSGGTPTLQDYVFGIFLHGGTDSSYSTGKNTLTVQNFSAAKSELLREQITAGLASCGIQ
jgi:hypothetical protein